VYCGQLTKSQTEMFSVAYPLKLFTADLPLQGIQQTFPPRTTKTIVCMWTMAVNEERLRPWHWLKSVLQVSFTTVHLLERWKKRHTSILRLQNTSSGYSVGTEGLQEKAGTSKEKLDGHHQTWFEGHGHHLGWSRRTGDRQSRMASTCGSMHPSGCGMN